MKLIPKHTSGSPIKALKLSRKDVRNLDKATSVEGYGDKVITDEYGNFIPASEIYKYGIVNSSGDMEGFIPEILVSPKYSITKEDLKPKLYSGNIANHPDAKYMSNAYLDAQIQKAKNTEEADKKAGEVNPLTMLNLASAGMSNYMSPTQVVRLGYDVVTGKGKDYLKGKFFEGNNGIVSDSFAKEHPLWSMTINGFGDVAIPLAPFAIKNIPKGYRMAKTKFNNIPKGYRTIKTKFNNYINRLRNPNGYFDYDTGLFKDPKSGLVFDYETSSFTNYKDRLFPDELFHRVDPNTKKAVDFIKSIAKKPLGKITLKGPSYSKNGRTYTLQPTQNWAYIQHQRFSNGAYDRLSNMVREEADAIFHKRPYTTDNGKRLGNLNDIKGYLDDAVSGDVTRNVIVDRGYTNNAGAAIDKTYYVQGIDRLMEYSPSTRAHEFAHMAYTPIEPIPTEAYNPIGPNSKYLFINYNGNESSARLSQLKNAAGLTSDEPMTPELFEYFRNNYDRLYGEPYSVTKNLPNFDKLPDNVQIKIPDLIFNENNSMTEWFNSIPPEKVKAFLDWGNKQSLALTGAIAGGAGIVTQNNE